MKLAEHVENGRFRAAFGAAVDLWRAKPHAALAALVLDLVAAAETEKGDPSAENEDPAALPARLDRIFVEGNSNLTRARLQDVLPREKGDPRIFDWLVAQVAHPRFDVANGNPRRLYQAIVAEIAKLRDERVAPWVRSLPAFLEAHRGKRHGQLSPDEIAALTDMFASCTFPAVYLEALTPEEEAEIAAARVPLEAWKSKAREAARKGGALRGGHRGLQRRRGEGGLRRFPARAGRSARRVHRARPQARPRGCARAGARATAS